MSRTLDILGMKPLGIQRLGSADCESSRRKARSKEDEQAMTHKHILPYHHATSRFVAAQP